MSIVADLLPRAILTLVYGSQFVGVDVADALPSVRATGPQTADEGTSTLFNLGSFVDPGGDDGPWTVTVSWGDGSLGNTLSTNTIGALPNLLHSYADNGVYAAHVIVSNTYGAAGAAAFTATVNNVAPTIAINGANHVNEGSPYSLTLGAVTDPGADTVTNYVVHWGDGASTTYASNGTKTHAYADGPNTYAITVDLVDEDGTFLIRANALSVTVDNVPPTIAIGGNTHVNEGSTYGLNLGAVTDPGIDTVTSYIVHWGDGASNTYATNGTKTHTSYVSS